MPHELPAVVDVPRDTVVLSTSPDTGAPQRLHRSLGCTATVVVALDPALEQGDVVLPFLPLSGLPVGSAASLPARPWVRLEVQGWDAEAIEACDEVGVLDGAGAVELDVAVADGVTRAPSLAWVLERLAPRFTLAMMTPTHGDPTTGATWAARVVFAQPST